MGFINNELKACIIIPSLEPDEKLLILLENLRSRLAEQENSHINAKILIIDDGSGDAYAHIFEQAKTRYDCVLLRHAVNLGKGRALKTAFNYFLNELPDYRGVVTVDSDGQHAVDDVICCIKQLANSTSLILGSRNFDSKEIPFKSSIGNKLTRTIFNFLCGIKLTDTQTGLRAIPVELLSMTLTIHGERFEFEMNMLIECGERKIKIVEIPIETIYSNNNKGTHFNPLKDSARIYARFLKYFISSFSAFVIDIVLFSIFQYILKNFFLNYILLSTIIARIASSLYNYFFNKTIVFHGYSGTNTMLKYYILASCQMLISGVFTMFIFSVFSLPEVHSKIIVDTILFFISFYIQRHLVFRRRG